MFTVHINSNFEFNSSPYLQPRSAFPDCRQRNAFPGTGLLTDALFAGAQAAKPSSRADADPASEQMQILLQDLEAFAAQAFDSDWTAKIARLRDEITSALQGYRDVLEDERQQSAGLQATLSDLTGKKLDADRESGWFERTEPNERTPRPSTRSFGHTSRRKKAARVRLETARSGNDVESPPQAWKSLMINRFPRSATKEQLEAVFSAYGTLESVSIAKKESKTTGQLYGFANFIEHKAAAHCLEALKNGAVILEELHGKTYRVKGTWAHKSYTFELKAGRHGVTSVRPPAQRTPSPSSRFERHSSPVPGMPRPVAGLDPDLNNLDQHSKIIVFEKIDRRFCTLC